ncbi:MAG: MBL fold metallo-hydrolase [Lachnospiraceae bacterium]|nr:MBL fold metallo-hydrolase [Lachnospiraceae bacterium]MBQ7775822.1 MBL fold metallo-hydrolase [Lachnospiraceae bacterium]
MSMITQLHYDNTNTYIIHGDKGAIMFDTGWAGTLPRMYQEFGEKAIRLSDIKYLLISHYHPDHMGIAQEIADKGVTILVMESQVEYLHASDKVFEKDKRYAFRPIDDKAAKVLAFSESRNFLQSLGIQGCIIPTPGHSDDSVSLILDEGAALVGDLYPLYELEAHEEPGVQESWELILSYQPKKVYYGHAKTAVLQEDKAAVQESDNVQKNNELYHTVKQIMRYIDKGMSIDKIAGKLKVEREFVNDVCRMYLTHQNVGVQGILDRIEIKGR